jgi:hypothetical protein
LSLSKGAPLDTPEELGQAAMPSLNADKTALIDFACQRLNMRSTADLGAVWAVDGGYTIYAISRHHIEKASLVDTNLTPGVLKTQAQYPNLRIIQGNFGDPAVRDQVGEVDGIFLFDVLLHQVAPDWDEVLRMYSSCARMFLIYNQQFTNLSKATRLLELGKEEYFRNCPHAADEEPYKTYFNNLDTIHPEHGRPCRDIHNIWQWGITDPELINCMYDLGYTMQYFKNCGQFGHLPDVENHAFVFSAKK